MRAKNKIIEGCYKNYRFEKRYGKLYLRCLENEFAINQMTVLSLQVLDYTKENSLPGILTKGFIFSKIFGTLGMLAGTLTASKKEVYYLKITFCNGESGLAVVNKKIYDMLVSILFDL